MFIFLITACSPELPTPVIESIAPEVVVAEQVTTVTVIGKDFHPYLHLVNSQEIEQIPDVNIHLTGDSATRIEMDNPTIIDAETLQFETTSELLSGSYLVEAEWEDGREATSVDYLQVNPTPLANVIWLTFESQYQIDEWALAQIQAVDIDGEPYSEAAYVQVTSSEPLEFRDLLDNQITTDTTVEGYLSDSGLGLLAFTSNVPANVDLSVRLIQNTDTNDQINIDFVTGAATQADVNLSPGGPYTAGDTLSVSLQLLDDSSTPTIGQQKFITMEDYCSGGTTLLEVLDAIVVSHQVTSACTENVLVFKDAISNETLAQSSTFEVLHGPASGLITQNIQNMVQAGQTMEIVVQLVDAYNNVVTTDFDEIETQNLPSEVEDMTCGEFSLGLSLCQVRFNSILEGYRLLVETINGVNGYTSFISVVAGTADSLQLSAEPNPVTAGEDFDVLIDIRDEFGNALTNASATDFTLKFNQSPIGCNNIMPIGPELLRIRCQMELAGSLTLDAEYYSANGSLDLVVVPAEISNVNVVSVPVQSIAGEPLVVSVRVFDAYGNTVTTPVPSNVELNIDGQLLSTTVDINGLATWAWTPTTARQISPEVIYQGQILQVLPEINVVPGNPSSLMVLLDSTWTQVGVPIHAQVVLYDSYGNLASGSSNLEVKLGSDNSVLQQTSFTDSFDVYYTPSEARLEETFVVTSPDYQEIVSEAFDVVDNCNFNPEFTINLLNQADNVLCTDENPITIEFDTSGNRIHYTTGEEWNTVSSTNVSLVVPDGHSTIQAVSINESLCYSAVSRDVFGAPDRLHAYGAIDVHILSDNLDPLSNPNAVVEISGYRCDGTSAALQGLFARTTGGVLASNNTPLLSTGQGLAFSLDNNGQAQLILDVSSGISKGPAEVVIAKTDQSAGGSASFNTQSFNVAPHIHTVEVLQPSGYPESTILYFTIDMDTSQVQSSLTSITDASGTTTFPDNVNWISDKVVEISWPTFDPNNQPFEMIIPSTFMTTEGNQMEGVPNVPGSALELTIDSNLNLLNTTSCSVNTSTFRPDGDNGTSVDADYISISSVFSGTPSYVRWHVVGSNTSFYKMFSVNAATHSADFDGRDEHGVILPNGNYSLTVSSLNDDFMQGLDCTTNFNIDNPIQDAFTQ